MSETVELEPGITARGQGAILTLRVRTPADMAEFFGPHRVRSLRTTDVEVANERARQYREEFDAEYKQRRQAEGLGHRVVTMNDIAIEHATALAKQLAHDLMREDQDERDLGMSESRYDELDAWLNERSQQLGAGLARGNFTDFDLEIRSLIRGRFRLDTRNVGRRAWQRAGVIIARELLKVTRWQMQRQAGELVETDVVAPEPEIHPGEFVEHLLIDALPDTKTRATWKKCFNAWETAVVGRAPATVTKAKQVWLLLEEFAEEKRVFFPCDVSKDLIVDFHRRLISGGRAVETVENLIGTCRNIFELAQDADLLVAVKIPRRIAPGVSPVWKAGEGKSRYPMTREQMQMFFSHALFTKGALSKGKLKYSLYWIPLLMLYCGLRNEEAGALMLRDIHLRGESSYLEIDIHVNDMTRPATHRNRLKTVNSRRVVPLPAPLLELGFARYIEHLRDEGHEVLFPELVLDASGRLSQPVSSALNRLLRGLGVSDLKVSLYSLRHSYMDLMRMSGELPGAVSSFLMGHGGDERSMSTHYGKRGEDFAMMLARYIKLVRWPNIPVVAWQPDSGVRTQIRYRGKDVKRRVGDSTPPMQGDKAKGPQSGPEPS